MLGAIETSRHLMGDVVNVMLAAFTSHDLYLVPNLDWVVLEAH